MPVNVLNQGLPDHALPAFSFCTVPSGLRAFLIALMSGTPVIGRIKTSSFWKIALAITNPINLPSLLTTPEPESPG